MFDLFSSHTPAEISKLYKIGGACAILGLSLAFGLELTGEPMNWADRLGLTAFVTALSVLAASAVLVWRRTT